MLSSAGCLPDAARAALQQPSTSARCASVVAAAGRRVPAPISSKPLPANASARDLSERDAEVLRSHLQQEFKQAQYQVRRGRRGGAGAAGPQNAVSDFAYKLNKAWRIFFPEQQQDVSPKEEVKKRLRMVLVADRCGMSPASLSEMKKTIIKALQDYVDIEGEEGVEVAINNEPGLGTVYSVNIPIRRVRAESRFADEMDALPVAGGSDGVSLEWDPMDRDSDPSARFPMGC